MARVSKRATHIGLQALLGESPINAFLRDYWPGKLASFTGDAARLRGLIDIPEFESIDSILTIPCKSIAVQNNWQSLVVDAKTARQLYDWGYQVYLREIQPSNRAFNDWLDALERDLALPRLTIKSNVFFCKQECRSTPRWHFDPQESFTVQIRGTKRWFVAPNQHAIYPASNYIHGDPLSEKEKLAFHKAPPRQIRNAVSNDLVPGSVVFVPRGAWHTTQVTADSVHLDLMAAIPTWTNILSHALTKLLPPQARWRAPVIVAGEESEAQAQDELADLFEAVAVQLRSLDPAVVLREAGFPIQTQTKARKKSGGRKK